MTDPKQDPFADPTFAHVPPSPPPSSVAVPPRGPSYGALLLGGGALLLGGAGLFGGGVLTGALLTAARTSPSIVRELPPPVAAPPPPVAALPPATTPPPVLGPQLAPARPRIEVVFALDTTGSMGGLLKAAKQKVWTIVDQLSGQLVIDPASGELVRPRIALGLVAFRDRGDEYVTRAVPLTEDIDAFRDALAALRAAGGGDEPEAVGEGIRVATEPDMGWSPEGTPGRARVLFVLGDAPDKEGWSGLCHAGRASALGIQLDAVLCGQDPAARTSFEALARLGGGRLLQVDQRPATVAVVTPHDEAISQVQRRIEATVVAFGDARAQERTLAQWSSNSSLDAESYATRAGAQCKTGRTYDGDLLQSLDDGRVQLADVKPGDVSRQELVVDGAVSPARVVALRAERDAARRELALLVAQRDAWLAAHPAAPTTFDAQLVRTLRDHLVQAGLLRGGC